MTAAAWAPQLRSDGVHRTSREFVPFKIDMEFAEVITLHLVEL
jgi:hypothetical protein